MQEILFTLYFEGGDATGLNVMLWMISLVISLTILNSSEKDDDGKCLKDLNPLTFLFLFAIPFYAIKEIITNNYYEKYNILGEILGKLLMVFLVLLAVVMSLVFIPSTYLLYTFFYIIRTMFRVFMFLITWKPKPKREIDVDKLIDVEEFKHKMLILNNKKVL